MRTHIRPLLLAAFLAPLTTAAQVDTEPGNNTCEPLFPVDFLTLDVPNNAAMDAANDVDFFRVEVPDGGVLEAIVTPLAGGAAFSVQIWNSNCQSIASATGQTGNIATAAAVVCGGSFNVRVARQSGNAVAYTVVASIASGDAWMECNDTPATATPIPVDTTFEARLYATHTGIAAGTGFDVAGDQDWFRVDAPSCGVLNIRITDVNALQEIKIECFNSNMTSIANSPNVNGGANASISVLLQPGVSYIRISDRFGFNCGNQCTDPYDLSSDMFTVTLTFDTEDACECNNRIEEACLIPVNTTFEAKLWGINYAISNNSALPNMDLDGDQDWYKVEAPSCGVLNIRITDVNAIQEMKIECFDSTMTSIANSPNVGGGANASISVLLQPGTSYIRISDRFGFNCGNQCTDPYDLADDPFTVTLSFDTSDECECNNRIEEACLIPINTTFEAKLWGINYRISDNSVLPNMDFNEDQDWYQVNAPGCGVLNISIADVNAIQEMKIECFNSSMALIGTSPNVSGGAPTSLNVLLQEGVSYIRISDRFGFNCGNQCTDPYDLADDPFTVTLSFDTTDVCECNNTFTTACEQEVGEPFQFKIFGTNASNYYVANDRDFFKFTPEECGTMNFSVVSIPPGFTIRARLYSDTTNINSWIGGEASATGPNTLSMDRPVVAGQTYFLMVRENSDGAMNAQLMTGTIGITPAVIPPPAITVTGSTQLCPGQTVTLTSSVATGNQWSSGETTQSIVVSDAGVYSVTAYDGQGCPAASDPVVVTMLPATVADFTVGNINGGDVSFANGSSNATQYLWQFGDGSSSAAQNPTHAYAANGEYEVTLIAIGPCGQDTITQVVSVTSVGIEDHHLTRFTLRPNPTSGLVVLDLASGMHGRHITLLDATGRVVLEHSLANISGPVTMDLSGHENGLYLVQVRFADGTQAVQRVVKE